MADPKKPTPVPTPSRDVEKHDRPSRTLDETVRRPPPEPRPYSDNTVSDTLKPPPPPEKK